MPLHRSAPCACWHRTIRGGHRSRGRSAEQKRGYTPVVAFRGWPTEALEFYEGLEADNSKTYWLDHKQVYDEQVYAPMAALLAELEPEFGPGRIFRPYRDVRFSADKSPYKTSIAATLDQGGYLQLTANGLGAGAGMYHMAGDQLDRYRRAGAGGGTGPKLTELVAGDPRQGQQHRPAHSPKDAPRREPQSPAPVHP